MEIKLKQNITANDLLQDTTWFGETDHDQQSVENLKELNELLTDTVQKIYWKYIETKRIAENQNNYSARAISNEAKNILVNVVKMATDEEKWEHIDKLFEE